MEAAARFRRLYPWPLTLAALMAATALTYTVYYPATYVLAVAACRALFPFYVWYEEYWHAAHEIQRWVTLAPLPFSLIATTVGLRWLAARAVARWRPGGARGALRIGVWSVRGVLAAVALPSGLALAGALLLPALAFGPGYHTTRGKRLQRTSCSHCHSPYRPFHFFRPPEQWDRTIHRMRTLEGAPVDEAQGEKIARYLSSRCSYTDAWMFRAKCLRCHDHEALEAAPRTAGEWRVIVERAARMSPYAYRQDWLDQVVRYSAAELAVPAAEASPGHADRLVFEQRCGACHYLSTAAGVPARPAEVEPVVREMAAKVPGRMTADELAAVRRYLEGTRPEVVAGDGTFPHDHAVEVPW